MEPTAPVVLAALDDEVGAALEFAVCNLQVHNIIIPCGWSPMTGRSSRGFSPGWRASRPKETW